MKRVNIPYLNYILDIIKDIENSINKLSKKDFDKNKDVIYSNIKRIEIISEVVKNISPNLKEKSPEIEWNKFERIKDSLKDHYFGIDIDVVWELLKIDFHNLKNQILKIKEDLGNSK